MYHFVDNYPIIFQLVQRLQWMKSKFSTSSPALSMAAFLFWLFLGVCGDAGLVVKLCPTLATPWTVAHRAPLSVGFSRQEYWSGLPFPSLGDLPHPGIKPRSPALQTDSLPTELQGKPPWSVW